MRRVVHTVIAAVAVAVGVVVLAGISGVVAALAVVIGRWGR